MKLRRNQIVKILTGLGLLAIMLVTYQGMNMAAYSGDYYAPGMAMPDAEQEPVWLIGRILIWNDTMYGWEPLANEEVRLWATDQLFENRVWTDEMGWYESADPFRIGQLVRVTVLGEGYTLFISYHAEETFELDTIYIGG